MHRLHRRCRSDLRCAPSGSDASGCTGWVGDAGEARNHQPHKCLHTHTTYGYGRCTRCMYLGGTGCTPPGRALAATLNDVACRSAPSSAAYSLPTLLSAASLYTARGLPHSWQQTVARTRCAVQPLGASPPASERGPRGTRPHIKIDSLISPKSKYVSCGHEAPSQVDSHLTEPLARPRRLDRQLFGAWRCEKSIREALNIVHMPYSA
jgi:hypothetical protein